MENIEKKNAEEPTEPAIELTPEEIGRRRRQEAIDKSIAETKDLRLRIDRIINSVRVINGSRETEYALKDAQRAKSFLGLVLKSLGTDNPYPKSSDASSPVIEKQADHQSDVCTGLLEVDNHTGRVKFMRDQMEQVLTHMGTLKQLKQECGFWSQQSLVALVESKHWLGWELDRLRESDPNQLKLDL